MTKAKRARTKSFTACGGVRGYETITRVVFGGKESVLTRTVGERLRARGYTVEFVRTAEDARTSAGGRKDTAIVVPVLPAKSLLATAKIVTSLPTAKVILLAPVEDERVEQFAEFIDANIAFETDGPDELLAAVIA